jgi:Predicted metal-binding integral membrane protein (DUF2182)
VHETREGRGSLRIGEVVSAEMEPFRGPDGTLTTLRDSLFSTVPGSPADVARPPTTAGPAPPWDGLVLRGPQRHPVRLPHHLYHPAMTTAAATARRRLPVAVPVAIALARAAAVAAHATGVAGRFHHDALFTEDVPSLGGVAGYALAWTVMVTAIMLPSAVPLLRLFVETSATQQRRGRLLACFTAGYLAVWLVFGWAALVFDGGVHQTVDALRWLAARPWLVGRPASGWPGPSSSRPSRTAASPSAGTRPPSCCATTAAAPGPRSGWAGATACTAWAAAGR